jgi:hypothetical protein
MKQFRLLLITLLLTTPIPLFSQCSEGEIEITVSILTDNYPGEITWILTEESGTLLSGGPYSNQSTTYESSVCISDNGEPSCLQFVINDSYGDGICCGYGTGAYYLLIDGVEIASGGNYGSQDSIQFDCAPGINSHHLLRACWLRFLIKKPPSKKVAWGLIFLEVRSGFEPL